MRSHDRPPRWLAGLLRLIRDPLRREVIEGDLEEGFRRRLGPGSFRALLWYGGQVLRTVAVGAPSEMAELWRLRGLRSDLRDALRGLRARPGLAVLVAATLGLGFGANTAMLGIAEAVLFRPLPYPEPDRLLWVHVARPNPGERYGELSYADVQRLRAASVGLSTVGGFSAAGRTVTGEGLEPMELDFARVTEGFFETLGLGIFRGRGFTPDEVAAGLPLVVLSHAFWVEAMGADPEAVGREIRIRGVSHTVVGVAAPDARFPAGAAFWRPLTLEERADDDRELQVVGRLARGTEAQELDARLRDASASLVPSDDGALTLWAEPMRSSLVRGARAPILILLGGAWLVLLIACANVANLLLARAEERRGALAVRAALGASRGRLVRLQLLEAGLLSGLGGVAGVVAGAAVLPILVAMAPDGTPRILDTSVDPGVLGGMAALAVLATLLAGAAPALGSGSLHPGEAMNPGRSRVAGVSRGGVSRGALVAGQVALSNVLITGAALLLSTLYALTRGDPGFDPRGVVAAELYPSPEGVQAHGGEVAYYRALVSSLSSLPGVTSVGLGSQPPTSGRGFNAAILGMAVAGPDGRTLNGAGIVEVGPHYFEANGMRTLFGRAFTDADGEDAPRVALVNRELVARYLGVAPAAALGRELVSVDPRRGIPAEIEIVGVVDDVQPDPRKRPNALVYLPLAQSGIAWGTVHVRVSGEPASIVPAIRRELSEVDPRLPLNRIFLLGDSMQAIRAAPAFVARVLMAFGGLALVLALVGSYGVTAYGVSRRTPELGVRRALGARASQVVRLVLRQAGGAVLVGVALGAVGAAAASRLLGSLLFGVEALGPAVHVGVALAVAAAGILATYLPARRAAKVDPNAALRSE